MYRNILSQSSCFPFEIWYEVSLAIYTYQCCEVDVFLLKPEMKFLLKIKTYQCCEADVFLLKSKMKFLLKINTYQCYVVDVFLLKFDMNFLLKIITYHCCEVDVFFLKCDDNSLEINFTRADSTQVQMLLMSTHKTHASIQTLSQWNKIIVKPWSTIQQD